MPLANVDEFVCKQQALAVIENLCGEEDMSTERDADEGTRHRSDLVHAHPGCERPRNEAVAVEFDSVERATRHIPKVAG